MNEKTEIEKLRILLPHWIEHNHGHGAEFSQWAAAIREQGEGGVADLLEKAVSAMTETDRILARALEKLGGPLEAPRHHHHGHGHDHG